MEKSRFADMSQYGISEDHKRFEEERLKIREFQQFAHKITVACFNDCVKDFKGHQSSQTAEEQKCMKNCFMQNFDQL